jgi:hypothetical protein
MDTTDLTLTEEETRELKERPISPDRREDFTDAQFECRLGIAKKICAHLEALDVDRPEWAQAIYAKVPPWGVYTSDDNGEGLVRRVYGACLQGANREESVWAVSAHLGVNNDVIGGVPVAEIESRRIDRVKMARVGHTATPGLFIDPLGFYVFMLGAAEREERRLRE